MAAGYRGRYSTPLGQCGRLACSSRWTRASAAPRGPPPVSDGAPGGRSPRDDDVPFDWLTALAWRLPAFSTCAPSMRNTSRRPAARSKPRMGLAPGSARYFTRASLPLGRRPRNQTGWPQRSSGMTMRPANRSRSIRPPSPGSGRRRRPSSSAMRKPPCFRRCASSERPSAYPRPQARTTHSGIPRPARYERARWFRHSASRYTCLPHSGPAAAQG